MCTNSGGCLLCSNAQFLCDAIHMQIVLQFQDSSYHTPVPYHFRPMNLPTVFTALLPEGLSEDNLGM